MVACAEETEEDLDLTPQQIMNLLRLGLKDMTLGSRMVWECTTCYMCQEHCPERVRVADILYELRNLAYERFREIRVQGKTTETAGDKRAQAEQREPMS